MHLSIDPIARLVDELHCVTGVTVHVTIAIRNAAVAHQDQDLVNGLGVLRQIIPEHGRVIGTTQMSGGIPFLCVDEVWELGWVAEEEDWSIVRHHVPIAFLSAELDAEASRIASTVVRTRLATDGGEADSDRAFFARLAEDVGLAQIVEGLGASEGTVSPATFGVDNPLRDSFTVEMGEEINQVEILQ